MSLFAALMGDLDDDPFMGGHMRRMNTMMNSFFRDPFGDMMGRAMGRELMPYAGGRENRGRELVSDEFAMGFPMMGMPFPNMRNIFEGIGAGPNCHSFSSSTVMTMTPGPDGRPQVYQASQSVKQGPGGIRETKKTVADSRSGIKKMAIGHHINDRAHIIEREQNVYSGEQEERQDFINLDEEEAESFDKEWQTKSRQMMRNSAIEYPKGSRRRAQLALPSSQGQSNRRAGGRARNAGSFEGPDQPSSSQSSSEREGGEGAAKKRRLSDADSGDEQGDIQDLSDGERPSPKQPRISRPNSHCSPVPSPSKSSSSE